MKHTHQLTKPIGLLIVLLAVVLLPAAPASPAVAQEYAGTPVQTNYVLGRPMPPNANSIASLGFTFGSNRRADSPLHHGVDMENPRGTPVIAAADGVVVFAGSDRDRQFGPQPNFYGNVIVIQHEIQAPEGGTVYTLYGHLDRLQIESGQTVKLGQRIATVGATGIALGPHLHFEVRVGNPDDYYAVRNPELWYPALRGYGKIVGRITAANGDLAIGIRYVVSNAASVFPGYSYADPGLRANPLYNENFVMGDLRAGCYRFRVRGATGYSYDQPFCLKSGELIQLDVKLSE